MNKKLSPGMIVLLVLVFLFVPNLAALAIFGYVIYVILMKTGKIHAKPKQLEEQDFVDIPDEPEEEEHGYYTNTRDPEDLDNCPDVFCKHQDKGYHHVQRGKEVDPWDRPDIDVSKYKHH